MNNWVKAAIIIALLVMVLGALVLYPTALLGMITLLGLLWAVKIFLDDLDNARG